jgi:hypothetical protein
MVKANAPRIATRIRNLLKKELASHAQAHNRHQIFAESSPERNEKDFTYGLDRYQVVESIQAYSLTLANCARTGLVDPERSGSVLLLQWRSGVLGKVEIHEKNGQPALTRVSSGALALELEKLVHRLHDSAARRRKSAAEIRILSVPGIHLLCLWKHLPKSPAKDSFIPIMRNFLGLHRGHRYSVSHVNAVISRAATERIISWYQQQGGSLKSFT